MSEGAQRILANTALPGGCRPRLEGRIARALSSSWRASSARASSGSSPSGWPSRPSSPRSAGFGQDAILVREVARDHKRIDLYFANTLTLKLVLALPALVLAAGGRVRGGSRARHADGDRAPGDCDRRGAPHHDVLRRLPGVRAARVPAGRADHAADRHRRRRGRRASARAPMSSSSPRSTSAVRCSRSGLRSTLVFRRVVRPRLEVNVGFWVPLMRMAAAGRSCRGLRHGSLPRGHGDPRVVRDPGRGRQLRRRLPPVRGMPSF